METQKVKLERAGEKSAVEGSDPVSGSCIPKIFRACNSHKLQTKAIYHSTSRYMNRRELQSDQPIHVPLLRVLSFPPSDGISQARAPHLATTRKDNASCNVLFMFCAATRIQRRLVIARTAIVSMKPFKRRPVCEAAVRREARALCIVVGSTVRAAELASFVYAGAIAYDMTRVHACSDHAMRQCTLRCVARLAARVWRLRIAP